MAVNQTAQVEIICLWKMGSTAYDMEKTGMDNVNRDYGYVDPHRNTEQGEEYSADIEKVIPDEPSEPDAP